MDKRFLPVANFLLFGIGIYFCLFLAYSLYRGPAGPSHITTYLLCSAGGILVFGSSYFWKDTYKINLSIFFASLIFSIYLVEVLLTALNPLLFYIRGIDFDTRRILEVITDSRKSGVEIQPPAFPSQIVLRNGFENNGDRLLPLSSLSKKKTVLCNESGQYVIFNSDEHGFNNPKGLYRPGEVDILLVGDSYTHGHCVTPDENIASQLRFITQLNVISIGMGSNGPLMELGGITEFAKVLKPTTVLWFYYEGNDLSGLLNEMKSTVLMKYLEKGFSQSLFSRQEEVDRLWLGYLRESEKAAMKTRWIYSWPIKIAKLYYLRLRLGLNINSASPQPPPPPLFKIVMQKAKERVEALGGKFYFIYE